MNLATDTGIARSEDVTQTKTCSRCRQEKPIDDFYQSSEFPDGRQYNCKACGRQHANQWSKRNVEKTLLSGARERALKLGLPFNLELEDIVIPERCPSLTRSWPYSFMTLFQRRYLGVAL